MKVSIVIMTMVMMIIMIVIIYVKAQIDMYSKTIMVLISRNKKIQQIYHQFCLIQALLGIVKMFELQRARTIEGFARRFSRDLEIYFALAKFGITSVRIRQI